MATLNTTETRAEREAADWFARLNSRKISTAALEAFHAWRHEPANDAAYGRMESLWETSGRLQLDPATGRDITAALNRGARRRRWRNWLRAAILPIGGVALAGAAALYLAGVAQTSVYRTHVGEQRLVALADGTRLRLDTDTEVKVRLRDHARDVRLVRGQAFFDVAHDQSRPFIVEADGARVRALGTRFDVRLRDGQAQVTLVEGAVEVTHDRAGDGAPARAWRLAPGQALTPSATASQPVRVDVAAATSWTSGQLVFHATPLADAVAEVNRYSRTKVVLEAPALSASLVSGKFDAGDTQAFVAALCDLFHLEAAAPQDGEIRLQPKA
jgi:transmembrane sensor